MAARADFGGARHGHGPCPPRALRGTTLGWLVCGAHLVPRGGHQQAMTRRLLAGAHQQSLVGATETAAGATGGSAGQTRQGERRPTGSPGL